MIDNYYIDKNGVVHQDNKKRYLYNTQYIMNRYVEYGDICNKMAILRLSYLLGAINFKPKKILDIGYGNGAFLDTCLYYGLETYGYDISGFKIDPNHIILDCLGMFKQEYDVVCLFDSMEHMYFPEIIIENIKTQYIFVSVPAYKPLHTDEWFKDWKHRREDEHLHHYSDQALIKFFDQYNYDLLSLSNIEDLIRKDINNIPNITTAIFKRRI